MKEKRRSLSQQILFTFLLNINRSLLDFQIRLGQILTDNACAQQLNTRAEKNDDYQGWPAGNRIPEQQFTNDDKDNADDGQDKEENPEPGGNFQRPGRITYQTINGIVEQTPERPACSACWR